MNIFRILCALVIVSYGMPSAHANIYSYITESEGKSTDVDYTFSISAWTSDSDAQENPCYGNKYCHIWVDHRHYSDGTSGNANTGFSMVNIGQAKTIGDVRKLWIAENPLPNTGIAHHSGDAVTNECVGLFYGTRTSGEIGDHAPIFPGSICGIAPPPTGSCKFSGDATIDYGSVSPTALNGMQASTTVSVSCTSAMDLEAWLINPADGSDTVSLRADGSISARLTVNGQKASTSGMAFTAEAGERVPLTITSEAIVSGTPAAGEFSGSAVLFVSVP